MIGPGTLNIADNTVYYEASMSTSTFLMLGHKLIVLFGKHPNGHIFRYMWNNSDNSREIEIPNLYDCALIGWDL